MNDPNRSRRSKWDTPASMAPAAPAAAPPPAQSHYPMTVAQALEGQVSSLEAASAAAARINAMLISKGKLKLPPGIVVPPEQPDNKQKPIKMPVKEEKGKNEPLVAEVEINEVPIQCRNMLCKGATQEEISRITGAAVTTRGRYMSYADRATNNMGERPLYLCVQGRTKESVDRAVEHIKNLIGDGIQTKGGTSTATTTIRTRSRFSAATSTGPATINSTRPQGAPILSRPPAPGLGAQIRGPVVVGGGGDIRGPGVGGVRVPGPANPMVPPPAIQMAIQAAQSSGHYQQDKVFVGLEHADPSFNIREKVQGPGGAFLQHIRAETGANIYLRGRGSGFMEPTSGREAFENLYIYITHPKMEGLQAAKKLCENLVGTIQAEYMTHQSQIFQRSAPAMAAAHMIAAPPPRPGQPMPQAGIPQPQQQGPLQPQPQPVALGLMSQAQATMVSMPAVSTALSQTLAAQQHAQAILGAQRPVVSAAVSGQQGVVYPHLHVQVHAQPQVAGLPGPTGLALQARAPQPVPAPAPIPPPQRHPQQLPAGVIPAVSQPQLYVTQVAVSQGQHSLAQAQAQAAVQAAQAQVQAHAQAQMAQAQIQQQIPGGGSGGLPVGQPHQPVLQHAIGPPPTQQQQLQQQQQQHQPVKRRFREDLSPAERPEHHPPPMTNLGVSPPGHSPLEMAAGGMVGGQSSLLRLPGQPPEDRRLMPPPPNPQAMREAAARKRLLPPPGLDIHGGRISAEEEARIKRGRLVSYDTSGDSDEDEEAAGRARTRFDAGPRFQASSPGAYLGALPPRGMPPPSSRSTSTVTSSVHYKMERREPGSGGSPFWMARN